MPRLLNAAPRYRKHRASGLAVVTLNGRDHYLGRHGTKASKAEYDRLVGEWLAAGRCLGASHGNDLTVAELCVAYVRFAKGYYRNPDGSLTGSMDRVTAAVKVLRTSYGLTLAADFGPLALQALQRHLADSGRCRSYCNHLAGQIKRIFKWGVSQEMLPVAVYQSLTTVPGLKQGRTPAKETKAIEPVADVTVAATLPHLPDEVAAMVRLQQLTGMRPGEVCTLRPCDVDRTKEVWEYRPASHKTAWRGKKRVIFIGPQAQQVLLPWLLRNADAYCFSPSEAWRNRRRMNGSEGGPTRLPCRRSRFQLGERYTPRSYSNSILAACRNARVDRWSPNQLRHATATKIRAQFGGLEPVQAVLGHSHMQVSEIYAEKNLALAADVMRKIG